MGLVFIVKWATFKGTIGEKVTHKGLALLTTSHALFFTPSIVLKAAWQLSCKPEEGGDLAEVHVLEMLNA